MNVQEIKKTPRPRYCGILVHPTSFPSPYGIGDLGDGAYAFIGAGAVVTKHVPDYALLVGNPARQLGWMSEYGHRLYFDAEGIAECPESHEKYQLKDGKVFKL